MVELLARSHGEERDDSNSRPPSPSTFASSTLQDSLSSRTRGSRHTNVLDEIEKDVGRTYPEHSFFQVRRSWTLNWWCLARCRVRRRLKQVEPHSRMSCVPLPCIILTLAIANRWILLSGFSSFSMLRKMRFGSSVSWLKRFYLRKRIRRYPYIRSQDRISITRSIDLSIVLFIYLSIDRYLSICISISVSMCLPVIKSCGCICIGQNNVKLTLFFHGRGYFHNVYIYIYIYISIGHGQERLETIVHCHLDEWPT
jgi:hypothetical protein